MAGLPLPEVFDRAWRTQYPYWRAYALRLTRNTADAEDVLHEAAARTLKAAPDLDSEIRLSAYMRTAIRHVAFGVVKHRGREITLDEERAEAPRGYASSALQLALDDEHVAERREMAVFLRAELENLPDERREAVELLVLEHPPMKLREVAALQGVGTSTVHYRLQRGLDALAEALGRARAGRGTSP